MVAFGQQKKAPAKSATSKAKAIKSASDNFSQYKLSRWSLGIHSGINYTVYDIPMDVANFTYGAYLKYSVGHVLAFRIHYMGGLFSGTPDNAYQESKNGWFENSMNQYSFQLLANIGGSSYRRNNPWINVYIFAGLAYLTNDAIKLKPDVFGKKETYTGTDITTPFGLGAKIKLSNALDLGIEWSLSLVKNDDLDLFNPSTYQGYPDFFGYTMFSLGYNFTGSKRKQHMDWHNPVDKMYNDLSKKSLEALNELKKDSDNDGIPDLIDMEPDTKAGYKVDNKGITLDTDNDKIPDTDDADPFGFQQLISVYYPSESFKANSKMDVLQFDDSIPQTDFVSMNADGTGLPVITFQPNKYSVQIEQYPLLQQVARIMLLDQDVILAVIGHADNNKPDMTQFTIAEKRALAVKRQLMKIYEINNDRILVYSERDDFVKKYKTNTEGLDRKVEFRLIRKK